MCVKPKLIRNPKYRMNKKNGGKIPPVRDRRQLWTMTPCGQCYICRKKKAREWQMRLTEDFKVNKIAKVILLTFNTESLQKLAKECKGLKGYELDNQICRIAVKRFRERWRKRYRRSIRHWLITELGTKSTEHVHMHGLVWEEHYDRKTNKIIKHKLKGKFTEEIERAWQYGFVGWGKKDWQTGKWINYINERTPAYFTKYVTKKDELHKEYKQIILSSAGIGASYLDSIKAKDNVYRGKDTNQLYQMDNGGVIAMPEYFRRKIYTDDEREYLQGWNLDTGRMFIGKTEVRKDIGDDKIYGLQKALQEKNARLGFGDGRKNYERKMFENSRRREIHKKRGL